MSRRKQVRWNRAVMTAMRTEDVNANRSARSTSSRSLAWRGALGLIVLLLFTTVSAATVVDDFQTAQAQISAPPSSSSTTNGAGILGSDRDLAVARLAGSDPVSAEVVGGVLEMADGSGRARLEVVYDADSDPSVLDPIGLGGVDLTDSGAANALRVVTTLVADAVDLVVTVYTDGTLVSTAARRVTAAGTEIFPFGSFLTAGTAGAADFANVGAIVVELTTAEVALPPPPPPSGQPEPSAPETVLPAPVIEIDLIDTVGPAIAATKDALDVTGTSDVDPAVPGQTLTYRVEVDNTGGTATNVQVADVIDSNLTVVADSLTTRPFAVDDLYQAIGNIQLAVNAANGLLGNDRDVDDGAAPSSLTVTASDVTSVGGGAVAVAADGSFTYTSGAGFGGVDEFGYTVTDDEGQTDTGTVTVAVADTVWFVENTVAPGGAGTFDDPFHALASAEAASAAGHTIRVRRGDGTDTNHDVGINLKPDQKLIGAGVALVIGGTQLEPADAMGAPTISHTDHVVDLADDVEVRGLAINTNAAAAEHGIRGTAISGTIAISDVAITGNGNHGGVLLTGSPTANVTLTDVDVVAGDDPALLVNNVQSVALAGSCDFSSAGTVMDITSTTLTGTVQSLTGAEARYDTLAAASSFAVATTTTLTNPSGNGLHVLNSPNVSLGFGATSVMDTSIGAGNSGTAVNLATGNAGATFGFASLALVADGGTGLLTGAGTVDVASATSTIAATGGPVIDASGTAFATSGAPGLTVASLSSTNSAGRGLRLSSTTGNVVVTGTTLVAGAAGNGVELAAAGTFTTNVLNVGAATGLVANGTGQISVTMVAGSQIVATAGPAVDLLNTATSATLATLSSSASATSGVNLVGHSGTLVANGGTITGAAGTAFNVSGGAGTITYAGTVTNTAMRAAVITGRTGGTVTVSGAVGDTGTGVLVNNNTGGMTSFSGAVTLNTATNDALTATTNGGHTLAFSGGLDIDTTTGVGFVASGGGTVNVSGSGNSVTSTAATAVDIDAVTTGIAFQTVSSTGASAGSGRGIELTNLPAGAAFGVTTTTSIVDPTNEGLFITSAAGAAIDIDFGGTLTVNNATANSGDVAIRLDRAGAGSDMDFATVNVLNRRSTGIFLDNLEGTLDFGTTTIANPNSVGGYGIRVEDSGVAVTIAAANISDTTQTVAILDPGNDGVPDNEGDGDAIFLRDHMGGFTLNGGLLEDLATDGIDARNSGNLTISGVTIEDIGIGSANPSTISDAGLWARNLRGTNLIRDTIIRRAQTDDFDVHIRIKNDGQSFDELRLNNVDISNTTIGTSGVNILGSTGLTVDIAGNMSGTLIVENGSDFSGLAPNAIRVATGDGTGGSGTVDIVIDGTTLSPLPAVTSGGAIQIGSANDIAVGVQDDYTVHYNVMNTTIENVQVAPVGCTGILGGGVVGDLTGGGPGPSFIGRFIDNTVNDIRGRCAIKTIAEGDIRSYSLTVDGNSIQDFTGETIGGAIFFGRDGIEHILRGDFASQPQIRVTNNLLGTITPIAGNSGREGIFIETRNDVAGFGAAFTVDALVHNNIVVIDPAGGEAIEIDVEDDTTLNLTITDNVLTAESDDAAEEILNARADDAGSTLALDFDGNTATIASQDYQVDEDAGAFLTVENLATVSARNTGTNNIDAAASDHGGDVDMPSPVIIASSGRISQMTVVSTAFAALEVRVRNPNGTAAANGTLITFTAPGAGASGTFPSGNTCTTTAGVCSVAFNANGTDGAYKVTATGTVSAVAAEPAIFYLRNLP